MTVPKAAAPEGATRLAAMLALALTAVLWGSNHVAARAIHEALPLPALIFWRWGLALLALLPIALPGLLRERATIRRHAREIAVLGAVGVGLFSICLFAGAYHSLAMEVGLLNATTPIWVLLMAAAAGVARPGRGQVAGVLIALAGVLLVLLGANITHVSTLHFSIGNLWALMAAMLFAWYTYRLGQKPLPVSALSLTTLTALSGFILIFAPLYAGFLLTGGSDPLTAPDRPLPATLAVLYIALGPTLFGNLFWIYGASRVGAAKAGPFLYLSPLSALLLSTTLLGEQLTAWQVAGGGAILFGLWLSSRAGRRANVAA